MVHPLINCLGLLAVTFGALAVLGQYRQSVRNGLEGDSLSARLLLCLDGGPWALSGASFAHSNGFAIGSLTCLPNLRSWSNFLRGKPFCDSCVNRVLFGCWVVPSVIGSWLQFLGPGRHADIFQLCTVTKWTHLKLPTTRRGPPLESS